MLVYNQDALTITLWYVRVASINDAPEFSSIGVGLDGLNQANATLYYYTYKWRTCELNSNFQNVLNGKNWFLKHYDKYWNGVKNRNYGVKAIFNGLKNFIIRHEPHKCLKRGPIFLSNYMFKCS